MDFLEMKKRVAFVISAQHFIPHGGIGQFLKGFCEMANDLGWIVDVILDKSPNQNHFTEYVRGIAGKLVHPKEPLSYRGHTQTFSFADSYCLERMLNFRTAMMDAFQTNVYDLIVVNTPEAIVPIYGFDIHEHIPVVFYTHNENMVFKDTNKFQGVFNGTFDEFFLKTIGCDGIKIGTQCQRNVDEMKQSQKQSYLLPMPLPERSLMETDDRETTGVLFIGRWEDRKNPKEFLRVIEETGLPARVMTNDNGAKSFEKELKRIGVDFEIKAGIIGQEKVDFIKGSRVFYMPSKSECYPFAFFETHGHVASVVLEDYRWFENFDQNQFIVSNKKDVAQKIKELYNNPFKPDISYIKQLHETTKSHWESFMQDFEPKKSQSSAAKVNTYDDFFYSDFISGLDRFASIDDVISVLANRWKYQITYTKDSTWFSKQGNEPKNNNNNLESFFE